MLKRLHIRQFLAVVNSGNFSRAAQQINVTQPTLSLGIAELERVIGERLFIRERRQIRLTNAGSAFLPKARIIEQGFQSAESLIGSIQPSIQPLRLAVLTSLSTEFYYRIAKSYAAPEPLELFEGTEGDIRRRFAQGKIDVAITILKPEDLPQNSLFLFEDQYCVFLPSGHPLAVKELIHSSDIASETMIARRSCELLQETSQFFTQRGIRPLFSMKSHNDDRCIEMVKAGIGITTAPKSLERQGVVAVPLADYNYRRKIGLIFSAEWLALNGIDHALVKTCKTQSIRHMTQVA